MSVLKVVVKISVKFFLYKTSYLLFGFQSLSSFSRSFSEHIYLVILLLLLTFTQNNKHTTLDKLPLDLA